MQKRFVGIGPLSAAAAATVATLAIGPRPAAGILAFPGAEGFGANAAGGRGGDVYHVTTLVDDPNHLTPGSLFYGLYEKNVPGSGTVPGVGRTIVFDVGGTIHLGTSTLDIKNIKNVTIAGQTAPGGITIIGNNTQVTSSSGKETSNIIIQNVAFRKGTENGNDDSLTIHGAGNTHDIIADHISGSWSEDEVISVAGATNHSQDVTVQYSTMSEALQNGHQYGSLIRNNQSEHVSYLHNFYSNNASRNPRPGSYDGTTLDFEFQNNVIYNWSDRAGYIAQDDSSGQLAFTQHLNMNYRGNYLIAGPSTPSGGTPSKREIAFIKEIGAGPLALHVYQADNKIDSTAGTTHDGTDTGWTMFQTLSGTTYSAFPDADKLATPFSYPASGLAGSSSSPDTPDAAYGKVISSVGAFAWARSATDQRLINEALTYTGTAALVETSGQMPATQQAEYNAIASATMQTRPAGYDTDNDGMPNWWETLRGYDTASADNNTLTSDGYTRLEHYLHDASMIANFNSVNADGNWSDHLNWRGTRPELIDSTANFVAGNASARTVNVDIPVTLSHVNFSSANSYVLAGAGPINLAAIAGSVELNVTAGSHAIWAPVTLSNNLIVTSAGGSGVTLSNLQPSSVTLTKAGAGGLAVNNVRAGGLNVTGGSVVVLPDGGAAGTSKVTALTLAAGTRLDLNNNKLITASPIGTVTGGVYSGITGLIQSGRAAGNWSGNGIVTSQSDATSGNLTSIGVATAAQVKGISATQTATWSGQSVTGSDTLVMYTYGGDANLDGKINVDDYGRIDFNIPLGTSGWFNGDFNYDGKINVDDYGIIDFNIAIQGPAFSTASPAESLSAVAIPEPTLVGLLAAVGLTLLPARRRRGA